MQVIVLTCDVKNYPDERMWCCTYSVDSLQEAKTMARQYQNNDLGRKYFLNYMSLDKAELLKEKYLDYASDVELD